MKPTCKSKLQTFESEVQVLTEYLFSPIAFIPDLKVLACVRPKVSCCVAVAHPHEAFRPDHFEVG